MINRHKIIFIIILIIFLIINFSIFDDGHYSDLVWQQNWGKKIAKDGIFQLYINNETDYPPLYLLVLKINSQVHQQINKDDKELGVFIAKLVPTICNAIIGIGIFVFLKKENSFLALISSVIYLFNPAIIYNTAYWGQVDSVYTMFVFFCLLFMLDNKRFESLFFFVIALFTKVQSLIIFPVILASFLMFKKVEIIKSIIILFLVVSIILLPFIITGSHREVMLIMMLSVDGYPFLTVNAFNFWFLISPQAPFFLKGIKDSTIFLGTTYKTIGLGILSIFSLLNIYQLNKKKTNYFIILSASFLSFAFFMLPTQIHERYLFPFFSLFSLIALKNWNHFTIYFLLTMTYLINLIMIFPYKGYNPILFVIQWIISYLITNISFISVAKIVSFINIIVFFLMLKLLLIDFHLNLGLDIFKLRKRLKVVKK